MPRRREWFGEWFNSPYYHVLYQHRDEVEAQQFIDRLSDYFHFCHDCPILDLACGKERHSIYLNSKGLTVTGIDLSEENIKHANQFANKQLHFYRHDMRAVFREAAFDYVLNLFTSFGYFDTPEEHQQAISAVATALKPGGRFLLDFLNPYTVINNLLPVEHKTINGIDFHITKSLQDGFIIKDIRFTDQGKDYQFQEKVKAIRRVEFVSFFEQAGLVPQAFFGDYHLTPYQAATSERLIMVVYKPKNGTHPPNQVST